MSLVSKRLLLWSERLHWCWFRRLCSWPQKYLRHCTVSRSLSGFLELKETKLCGSFHCWGRICCCCCVLFQLIWLNLQLGDYGMCFSKIPILCDNTIAICISKNPGRFSRTKHIDVRHHFLRDNVEKEKVSLDFCRTEDQVADIFTKPLNREPFMKFRLLLGLISLN